MCSRYEAPTSERLLAGFGTALDQPFKTGLWPGYMGPFLRARGVEETEEGESPVEALAGMFGLLPFWAKDTKLARSTYNSRSESAATKPSFRTAWAKAQHCIIPCTAFYEPDWRSGKAVPTRITRADGGLIGIAGLWERWVDPAGGEVVHSYSMLTINASQHELSAIFTSPMTKSAWWLSCRMACIKIGYGRRRRRAWSLCGRIPPTGSSPSRSLSRVRTSQHGEYAALKVTWRSIPWRGLEHSDRRLTR